jgi:biotin synthase-like enzyme
MGLESPQSGYAKLNGTDTVKMSHDLRSHGIKLLGSTIVGMEHHTPENLPSEIDYACSHETDFHQFMLYTPVPGTPLYNQMEAEGTARPRRPSRYTWTMEIQLRARQDYAR